MKKITKFLNQEFMNNYIKLKRESKEIDHNEDCEKIIKKAESDKSINVLDKNIFPIFMFSSNI